MSSLPSWTGWRRGCWTTAATAGNVSSAWWWRRWLTGSSSCFILTPVNHSFLYLFMAACWAVFLLPEILIVLKSCENRVGATGAACPEPQKHNGCVQFLSCENRANRLLYLFSGRLMGGLFCCQRRAVLLEHLVYRTAIR